MLLLVVYVYTEIKRKVVENNKVDCVNKHTNLYLQLLISLECIEPFFKIS